MTAIYEGRTGRPYSLTFYIDLINVLNMIDDDWGLTEEYGFPFDREVVEADMDGGQYVYEDFSPENIRVRSGDIRSRWAIQLGARLSF